MKKPVVLALGLLGLSSCALMGGEKLRADNAVALGLIREAVIAHAPYKQWDISTGQGDETIGRTPGAACEGIRFLAEDAKRTGNETSKATAVKLSDWIITLQEGASSLPVAGGVPSTPDLPAPANSYYYAIDAAFCADAMLNMAELTGQDRYRESALGFGAFLLDMMRDERGNRVESGEGTGMCEAVVQSETVKPAWNCRRFTKNLMALPVLARLHALEPKAGYGPTALRVRKTLMPGMEGFWEYAEGPVEEVQWHRIQGSYGEPNHFINGDTLAYGLQGLFRFEGDTQDVRRLYGKVMEISGAEEKTEEFDPRFALPGYILASEAAPDAYSAYYDVVTAGLLHPVRLGIAPEDANGAASILRKIVLAAPQLSWQVDFGLNAPKSGKADISTLSATGLALLEAHPADE